MATARHNHTGFLRITSEARVTRRNKQIGIRTCESLARAGRLVNVTNCELREQLVDLLIYTDKLQCDRQQALETLVLEVLGQLQEV